MTTLVSCAWCCAQSDILPSCEQCNKVHYCNTECQKRHWALHKTRCGGKKSDNYVTLREINDMLAPLTLKNDPLKRESVTKLLCLLDPLPFFWSHYLEVRPSDVHGLGVFAKRHLPPGVVLTGYPCHLLGVGREVEQVCSGTVDASAENLQHLADVYSYSMRNLRLIGLPERHTDQRLLGHILNDACLVNVFHGTPLDALRDPATHSRLLKLYYRNVLKHTNCKFQQDAHGLLACVVSTREIAPGEELLLTYGLPYWHDHNYGAATDENYPFLLQNMLTLRETDAEFCALSDASLRRDRATLQGQ